MTGEQLVVRVVAGPDRGRQAVVGEALEIGRGVTPLLLESEDVSRSHCRVEPSGGSAVVVQDLGSRRGTVVAGRRIETPLRVGTGETFTVGSDQLRLLRVAPGRAVESVEVGYRSRLHVVEPGGSERTILLTGGTNIGSNQARCEVHLGVDHEVAPVHARIWAAEGEWWVKPMTSEATYVDGQVLDEERVLRGQEQLTVGRTALRFELPTATGGDDTATSVEVDVAEETGNTWSVRIEAAAGTTVARVAEALAEHLGLKAAGVDSWALYLAVEGLLLPPSASWSSVGVRRGATVTIGPAASAPVLAVPPGDVRQNLTGAPVQLTGVPQQHQQPRPVRIDLPTPPPQLSWRGRGLGWQIAGGLGATAVGLGLALVNPAFVIMAVAGLVLSAFAIITGLGGERSRSKSAQRDYEAQLAELDDELNRAQLGFATDRFTRHPDPAEVLAWPDGFDPALWRGRASDADFLRLRLGTGPLPVPVEIDRVRDRGPQAHRLDDLLGRYTTVEAPVTVPEGARVVSVTGADGPGLARWLVVQAAATYPPRELRIVVLSVGHDESWSRWLPNAAGPRPGAASVAFTGDAVDHLVSELQAALAPAAEDRKSAPTSVLVLVDATAAQRPAVSALLSRLSGSDAPILVVAAVGAGPVAPGSDAVVGVGTAGELTIGVGDAARAAGVADTVNVGQALLFARALAPASDGAASGFASTSFDGGLLTLLGIDDVHRVDAAVRWSEPPPVVAGSAIGVDGAGQPLALSLLDGPHGLVAGTTGSGKSELLLTLLAGMAATHPPRALAFALVDFKGGATFGPLSDLPHVAGTVTNLDATEASRAVTSFRAELVRRQELLARAGVANLDAYHPDPARGLEVLPRLVLVIDEFAQLAATLPEVMDAFVDIATVGRSLGVHLLLATQSPGGVVSAKIDANTNIRICLRTATADESRTVLGSPVASEIQEPGRGFIRVGGGSTLTSFQGARINRPIRAGAATVRVTAFGGSAAPATRADAPVATSTHTPTELEVLVDRILQTAPADAKARALWLPPLPTVVTSADLDGPRRPDGSRLWFRLGRCDVPEEVAQPTIGFDLAVDGTLLIMGVRGKGTSTVACHIVQELAGTHRPDQLHVYGIGSGGTGLDPVRALPHTGDVVEAHDIERITRLVARLGRIVTARRGGAVVDDRFLPAPDVPVVLVIDDVAVLRQTSENVAFGALFDDVATLVRSGPAVGVHVVATAQRASDLPSTIFATFARKVLLQQAESLDYDVVGIPATQRPDQLPPGRAFVAGSPPRLVQVAMPSPGLAAEASARWQEYASTGHESGPCAGPVPSYPDLVRAAELVGEPPPGGALLGVGDPELGPVAFDFARNGPHLVVTGDERSGRTTALVTVAASLLASEPDSRMLVIAPRPSAPLDVLAAEAAGRLVVASSERAMNDVLAEVASVPSVADAAGGAPAPTSLRSVILVIDDAETLPVGVSTALEPVYRAARDTGLRTVSALRATDFARSFDPLPKYLRSQRAVLLLMPRPEHAELIGGRVPTQVVKRQPGRGLLSLGDAPVPVQVAVTDDPSV